MNRQRINQYAKDQERRVMSTIESLGGKVLEYYGSRGKHAGDMLVKLDDKKIRIDHKSTRNEVSHRIYMSWLPYLSGICLAREHIDGPTISVVTLSFYKCPDMYAMSWRHFDKEVINRFRFSEGKTSKTMRRRDFEVYLRYPTKCIELKSDEHNITFYIHKLDALLRAVKG